ncbi:hypothetical protein E1953_13585 [Acinetobacter baumannii]|nr:hypothetical protein E1953_13585 [Acinetobacter baumannii]
MLLYILYGLIACLLVFIKYHLDLKFIPNERKWYEKIRFILPMFLLPIFFSIYYFWDHYPEKLMEKDTQVEMAKNQNSEIFNWPLSTSIVYSTSQNAEEEPKTKFQKIGEKYGTYGDSYGSLNTLFTGLAFAGLIISIFIQLLELRQTRKELAEQSKAMVDQKTEFAAQTKILEKQTSISADQQKIINDQFIETQKVNFLNHFYKLIDEKNNLMNNLSLQEEDKILTGHSVFSIFTNEFIKISENFDPDTHNDEYFLLCFNEFLVLKYGNFNYQLTTYYKIYRVILHTIYNSTFLTEAERKYYVDVFKMFISLEEVTVLMWISINDKNLNFLCNNFSLLKGLYHENLEKAGVYFFKYSAFKTSTWENVFIKYKKI